ncbi:MAG: hypothetical protein ACREBP_02990, partial [Sphingomicrobium sp.]
PIAGQSLERIGNQPQLRVRKINVSCVNCHLAKMAGSNGKNWLCNHLPEGFWHAPAPDNETVLYNLLANWKSRGCPD